MEALIEEIHTAVIEGQSAVVQKSEQQHGHRVMQLSY